MGRRAVLMVFGIVLLNLIFFVSGYADTWQDLQYRESQGDNIRNRLFQVKPIAEGVAVSSLVDNAHYLAHCDESGNTRLWRVDKKEQNIRAERVGNTITITGTVSGETINRQLKKNDLPWFQSLYYSLSCFLESDKGEIEFWMIRPDNLRLVKLRAEKEPVDTIRINGQTEQAKKIRLGLTGLLSYIWHGYYWYRAEDGVLLQYKDMKALPGRSKLTVRLCAAEQS